MRDVITSAWLAVATFCAGTAPIAAAAGFVDPVDAPASESALATRRLLNGVAIAGTRVIAVGQRGHVVLSEDGGRHWSQAAVPVSSDLTAVSFPTADLGWAVGHDGVVIATTDGGRTWAKQLDGRHIGPMLAAHYADYQAPDRAAVLQLVQPLVEGGADMPLLDVWFADARIGFAVGAFNLVLRTDDGGRSWTPWVHGTENPKGLHLHAIRRVGDAVYVVGEQGLVLKLDPATQRFRASRVGYNGSFFGVTGDARSVLVYGLRGNVFRSADGGASWRRVETGLEAAVTAGTVLADRRVVLVTQAGQVLVGECDSAALRLAKAERVPPASGVAALGEKALVVVGPLGARLETLP